MQLPRLRPMHRPLRDPKFRGSQTGRTGVFPPFAFPRRV